MSEELIVRKEAIADLYDIGDQIGSGQFAVVKKLQEKSTGKTFAAKFMKKKRSRALKKGMTQEQFLREADVLRSIDHKGVICLHEIFETQVEYVLILELLTGGELFEFLSEQEFLTEDEAVGFLKQVIEAIEYLHSKCIVHLDIKPENIVLKEERSTQIKLIDFGLARKLCKGEMVREIMGTPEFVAPEIIAFEAVGTETDMWAIGVLTYIMLSGASPFLGDDVNETFSNISMVDYEFDDEYFKDISLPAKDFISTLLVKNTRDRLNARECLEHEWMQEFEDQSSEDDDDMCDNYISNQPTPHKNELKKRRSTMIKTDAFRAFTARARWQKSLNKVIAISRLALLGKKNGPLQQNRSDNTKPLLITQNSTDDKDNNEEKAANVDNETVTDTLDISTELSPEKDKRLEEPGEKLKSDGVRMGNEDEEIEESIKKQDLPVNDQDQESEKQELPVKKQDKESQKQELPVNKPNKPVHSVSSSVSKTKEDKSLDKSVQSNTQGRHSDATQNYISDKIETNKPQKKKTKDAKKEASVNKERLNKFESLRSKFAKFSKGENQQTDKPRRKLSEESHKYNRIEMPERIRRKSDQLSLKINWEQRIAKANESSEKGHKAIETSQNKPSSNERQRRTSQPAGPHSVAGAHSSSSEDDRSRRISAPLPNEGVRGKRLDDTMWVRKTNPAKTIEEKREHSNIRRISTSTKTEVLKWEKRGMEKKSQSSVSRKKTSLENSSTTTDLGESTIKKHSIDRNETPVMSIDKRHQSNKRNTSDGEAPSVKTSISHVQGSGQHEDHDASSAVIEKEHKFVIQTLQPQDDSKSEIEPDSRTHRVNHSESKMGRKVGVVENPTKIVNGESSTEDSPRKSQEQRKFQTVVKQESSTDETEFPQYALTLQRVVSTDDEDNTKDDFVWVVTTEKNKRREFLSKVLASKMNTARNGDQGSAPVDIFEKRRIRHKPMSEKGPPTLKTRTKSTPQEPASSKAEIKVKHHSVATRPTLEKKNVAHVQLVADMPSLNFKIQMGEIKLADP